MFWQKRFPSVDLQFQFVLQTWGCFAGLLFLEAQHIEYQVLAKSEEGFALFTFSNYLNIKMLEHLGLFVIPS